MIDALVTVLYMVALLLTIAGLSSRLHVQYAVPPSAKVNRFYLRYGWIEMAGWGVMGACVMLSGNMGYAILGFYAVMGLFSAYRYLSNLHSGLIHDTLET